MQRSRPSTPKRPSWSCHFSLHVCLFMCFFRFWGLYCFLFPPSCFSSPAWFFPPHLSCICLISPALLPEFCPSPPSLHTCAASPSSALPSSGVFSVNFPHLFFSASLHLHHIPLLGLVCIEGCVVPSLFVGPSVRFLLSCCSVSLMFLLCLPVISEIILNHKQGISCLPFHAYGSTFSASPWHHQYITSWE